MSNIKVTVIVPVYNQESLVKRALESIPKREDIEIIAIDDGSTDDTMNVMHSYTYERNDINFIILRNPRNMGVAHTVNVGLDNANGEYIVLLGSDDYFYYSEFLKALNQLDGTDLVYFNLESNDKSIWRLTNKTKRLWCGSTKFMRREFIGDTREPEERRQGEDWFFYDELLKKNPTEKFTDLVVKHYNYPRKGSLTWKAIHGEKI